MEPTDPTHALAPASADHDLLWSSAGFEHAQRVAKIFAASMFVPEHLRGKVPECTIALTLAKRMAEDPLIVMQNVTFIKGKAGWAAQYVIARANRSGVFRGRINWRVQRGAKPIDFQRRVKVSGEWKHVKASMPDLTVTAYATLADTGEEVSFDVSSQMAIADGWADNEKYSTLPELMLRYRAAVLLVRLYAPDVMLGIPAAEEIETLREVEVVEATQAPAPAKQRRGRAADALAIEAKPQLEPIDVVGEPVPAKPAEAPVPAAPAPTPSPALPPTPPPDAYDDPFGDGPADGPV